MSTNKRQQSMRVKAMTWEAEDVLSVDLVAVNGSALDRPQPGAHVELLLREDLIRPYSLCGDVTDGTRWRVAVLREQAGRGGSAYIHDSLRPGAVIEVVGPRNNFALEPAESYLFIAGGIGITPLLPMIRAADADGVPWRLLYGGRRRASMAFLDELGRFGDKVTIAPQDEVGLLDLQCAISAAGPDAGVYCCGPEPLIVAVEKQCAELGRPAAHVERFAAREGAAPTARLDGDTAFEVDLTESGRRLQIPADRTITSVLEDEGIYIATSCAEGYCGTCETEVVAGTPEHRDDYLSEEQRQANDRMMVCVGRSKCAVLTLRL